MSTPKVSVVVPTYNGAEFLGEAIQSVLRQTYQDFEIIVVNDASPDATDEVIRKFDDPRLHYIKHEQNRGVANARKTGVLQARGAFIAHLDQDDFFHPEKLQAHVDYLEQHPDIGFTYNSRFELYPASGAVREILRPSPELTLADFVLGFPLAPSVWVQRREWILRDEIWEEQTFYRGREIVICGRLYMAGCKFAMIDRVLNYRRYHRNRVIKNVARQCEAERTCQQIIFNDPRFPPELLVLQNVASSNIYTMWSYVAYLQGDVELGSELLEDAIRLNPALLEGTPPAIVNDLIIDSIDGEHSHHEDVLKSMFENLPQEICLLSKYQTWAVTRGYLMQGVRAVLWDRTTEAQEYFSHVNGMKGYLDRPFLEWLTSHLLAYEAEFGADAVSRVIKTLSAHLKDLGISSADHKLKGNYYANRAFEKFHVGNYYDAQISVLHAILNYPANLANKGLLSVMLHSMPLLNHNRR
jgi:glycosyltransferase involved in cell wall biosynthesis